MFLDVAHPFPHCHVPGHLVVFSLGGVDVGVVSQGVVEMPDDSFLEGCHYHWPRYAEGRPDRCQAHVDV
jgi:hypothetical protein